MSLAHRSAIFARAIPLRQSPSGCRTENEGAQAVHRNAP
jgi:hypothetical protein